MGINQDFIRGNWKEIQEEVHKAWENLSRDELQKTKGDLKALAGLVQQKYGEDRDGFDQKFKKVLDRLSKIKEQKINH